MTSFKAPQHRLANIVAAYRAGLPGELLATVVYLIALGLASLAGSRWATVAIVLAWQLAVTPLALAAAKLGVLRKGLLTAALDRLIPAGLLPGAPPNPVSGTIPVTVTAAVIAAWVGSLRWQRRMAGQDPGRVMLARRHEPPDTLQAVRRASLNGRPPVIHLDDLLSAVTIHPSCRCRHQGAWRTLGVGPGHEEGRWQ